MKSIHEIRADFPILQRQVYGKPLVYLDNAATTQVPVCVTDAIREHYRLWHANIHRGIHYLGEQSSMRVEKVRETVAEWIGAAESAEIVFTGGTTESVNLVARAFPKRFETRNDGRYDGNGASFKFCAVAGSLPSKRRLPEGDPADFAGGS